MLDVDAIVVGGGVMGTSAARWLAQRGRETLLLERFEIGNAFGSSTGQTRIFRIAHPDPEDVRMARMALELWRELEDESQEVLLHPCGGLFAGPIAGEWALALRAAGQSSERIAAGEVAERWPAIAFGPGTDVLWQAEAGVLMAERAVRAQARLAVASGAKVLEGTPVQRLVAKGEVAEVRTPDEVFRAPVVVIAAGPWAGRLLSQFGLELPLSPVLTQVTYFERAERSPLPTLIDRSVASPADVYMVPEPEEPGAFKVGADPSGPPVDPEDLPFEHDADLVQETIAYAGPGGSSPTWPMAHAAPIPIERFLAARFRS